MPRNQMQFIGQEKSEGGGDTTESFGNWFADRCTDAGVPGRVHGLRKVGATRLADSGATEFEVMAYLGHRTQQEAKIC
ncbi:hypothetical protein C0081_20495 [Cohaesibacter celericrescens]|uniref:Tyr recombinase domain-containing protein n=1 Tax=Cohaesibacter celericrescens TaxID=2067669 RepID=A0A2N5XL33_9HYPH|nr:hypothetical protein C0081_20495 [Cohaesibacter celericrescens]